MSGGGSDKSTNINHQYHPIEDQVMMTEGHSFCCIDCDLLSTRMIHYIVFNLETPHVGMLG